MSYIALVGLIAAAIIYLFRKRIFRPTQRKLTRTQENANLIKVLLELDDDSREQLFELYKKQFGTGAARYARQTYLKWKSGSVRPNKQTFQRFLLNLPQVMSFDLKCEVLRELREAYCAHDTYNLTVSTDNWKAALAPLVSDLVQKTSTAEMPEFLNRRLSWLAEDDMQIAKAILAESQARQSRDTISLLEKEFSNIQHLLDNAGGNAKVTHVLQLPLGSITLQIKRGAANG